MQRERNVLHELPAAIHLLLNETILLLSPPTEHLAVGGQQNVVLTEITHVVLHSVPLRDNLAGQNPAVLNPHHRYGTRNGGKDDTTGTDLKLP